MNTKLFLLLFLILLLSACSRANLVIEEITLSPVTESTVAQSPTPSPTVTPTPTPSNYLSSENSIFQAELGQLFALRWDQSVEILAENLIITHIADIEFECPAGAECEVPLIATDYFEITRSGDALWYGPWQPEIEFDQYVISTASRYNSYDYHQHQFELILMVGRRDVAQAAQQTKVANTTSAQIELDCAFETSRYRAEVRDGPEVHMLGLYNSRDGSVALRIERQDVPMILVLSAFESTDWLIQINEGVLLEKIYLNNVATHSLSGAAGVEIVDLGNFPTVYAWSATQLGYENGFAPTWVYQLEDTIGWPLTTFTGCQRAAKYVLK